MPEPFVSLSIGAIAAYAGKDSLQRLLGPTADYLGQGLRNFTQRRLDNIGLIFKNAESKLKNRIDSPGEVSPKVLKMVLDEGSFSNDLLAIDYFGGILASSRTEAGRDDRGARLAKMVDMLSTYQLRAHYLVYATIRRLFAGSGLRFNSDGRPKMQIFIPIEDYFHAMDFDDTELVQRGQLLNHVFFGLTKDNLIDSNWIYGPREQIKKYFELAEGDGIVCGPSNLGVELFLSAFGETRRNLEYIFDEEFSTSVEGVSSNFAFAIATKI
jgi:hypothetical protein